MTALILLPKLDTRQIQSVSNKEFNHLYEQQLHVTKFLQRKSHKSIDELIQSAPKKRLQNLYFTELSGRLINDTAPKRVRQFILDTHSSTRPLKRVYKHKTFQGPLHITHNDQKFLLYVAKSNHKKSLALLEWLIDKPLLLLLTALLVSAPLCAFLSWHLTQPLRQLKAVANQVAQGDLGTKFPVIKNSDEFTQLANSMQLMVLSVKNMLNNQQRLLSDISHELRSPLTRLGLALAISKKHSGESKELQRIELEAEKIELMIAQMLNLSRIQLNPDSKETLSLCEFLEELFLDAKFEAHEYGKKFHFPELENITINIYPELAYRAIENIIRNAIKYAENSISVEISIEKNSVTLHISNDGESIPENELTNIFRPFYRLNEARDRESGGAGLGLSIAENAMFKHGGKIWAENINSHVCMHLQFPRFY